MNEEEKQKFCESIYRTQAAVMKMTETVTSALFEGAQMMRQAFIQINEDMAKDNGEKKS